MIVSHKHKFIFVKTHKTSTQTFLKFIKPHLGPNDVMAGDDGGGGVNEDTVVNVDKVFSASGKCAADLQNIYGNHIPWFMIRDVIGQDMWDEYTTFTIERSPLDRFLSLFYFLHPSMCKNPVSPSIDILSKHQAAENDIREKIGSVGEGSERNQLKKQMQSLRDEFKEFKTKSMLDHCPEAVREYFEDWMLVQLLTEPEDILDYKSYGMNSHQDIIKSTNKTAKENKLDKYMKMWKLNPKAERKQIPFIYSNNTDVEFLPGCTTWESQGVIGKIYRPITGQARFLNYGYYWDGKNITVDHIVDFKNVGQNMGKFFNKFKIDIKCDKNTYNKATQNAHFRLNNKKSSRKPVQWWYSGKRGKKILNIINKQYSFIDKLI